MKKQKVGTVKQLWRYPVKSMEGEILQQAAIAKYGVVGDRGWIVRDERKQENTTVRKTPKLLMCSAKYEHEPSESAIDQAIPSTTISLPGGQAFSSRSAEANAILSQYLQQPVSLHPRQPKSAWRFYRLNTPNSEKSLKQQFNVQGELPTMSSFSWKKLLELSIFATPLGHYYDAYPLHIVSSNSLDYLAQQNQGDFCVERFRPNIFIQNEDLSAELSEFQWVGGKLYIGNTILRCESKTVRCSMPAQPQAQCAKDPLVVKALAQHTSRHLGINVSIIKPGVISAGDEVFWEPESTLAASKLYRPVSTPIKHHLIRASLKLVDFIGK